MQKDASILALRSIGIYQVAKYLNRYCISENIWKNLTPADKNKKTDSFLKVATHNGDETITNSYRKTEKTQKWKLDNTPQKFATSKLLILLMISVLDLNNTELANQWWQLFDTETKQFYYYNIQKQKTSWTKPSNHELNSNINESHLVLFIANRILDKLTENLDFYEHSLETLIKEIRLKLESREETNLDKDLLILNEIFKQELNCPSPEFKKSFASFQSTNSFQNLVNSSSFDTKTRPIQPRTNPNYINVDLIDKGSGSVLKNTYIKLKEINADTKKEDILIKHKNISNSRYKLNESTNVSTNNLDNLTQVTLLLSELLNSDKEDKNVKIESWNDSSSSSSSSPSVVSSSSSNTVCYMQNSLIDATSTPTRQTITNNTPNGKMSNNLKLDSKNFSISNCFLANLNDLNSNNNGNKIVQSHSIQSSSCSLSRKKIEKKFSFLCSVDSTKIEALKNGKISEKNLNDISSLEIVKNSNFLFSPSSTTSLADITQTEKNHRFKNLRRSFNKTPKCYTETKNPTSLSYMIQPNKFKLNIENYSPQLARKPSEANLLIIKKNQIDLNVHHEKLKGFLFFGSRKKIPDHDLMNWTSQTIQKPLIKTNNKQIKKEACDLFKLIQIYMGDRKMLINMTNQNSLKKKIEFNSSNFLEQLNSSGTNDSICLEIMIKGWIHPQLRDELYLQIVKQTTQNSNLSSSLLGWQLMAVCLNFFPPTQKLYPFLKEYIESNLEETDENDQFLSRLAKTCLRRLEKINITGAKKGLKNPSIEEVILAKSTILNPSLFGASLDEIMSVQRKKCADLQLPWIQKVLSEAVLHLNGTKTEGIFRVPGDLDEVNNLKVRLEQLWCSDEILKDKDLDILKSITDPHLPASLLKLWYRELYDPLIPNELYDECIQYCDQPEKCLGIIKKLPYLNRMVFTYLIKFLKVFANLDNVSVTKMDANNLSMVMAPNCLRCKSNDPKIIMENTKKEMQFIKTLIHHLDTSVNVLN
ncbi:unnamed protein product [Brachionus calyciflorus]|uniref:Rho GTPase-activating protein 39 n=1 Tax=Brachionus calyciflorus TaxID=104777 RepID=A0A814AZC9_9BILA|nr:unnamed protein product [Brachionus calyciflorus]